MLDEASIRESHITTVLRFHLTSVSVASTKMILTRQWREKIVHDLLGCSIVYSLWKIEWFLKTLKSQLQYDPALSVLVIYCKKGNQPKKRDRVPMFIMLLFTTLETSNQPRQLSTDEKTRMHVNTCTHTSTHGSWST